MKAWICWCNKSLSGSNFQNILRVARPPLELPMRDFKLRVPSFRTLARFLRIVSMTIVPVRIIMLTFLWRYKIPMNLLHLQSCHGSMSSYSRSASVSQVVDQLDGDSTWSVLHFEQATQSKDQKLFSTKFEITIPQSLYRAYRVNQF